MVPIINSNKSIRLASVNQCTMATLLEERVSLCPIVLDSTALFIYMSFFPLPLETIEKWICLGLNSVLFMFYRSFHILNMCFLNNIITAL